MVCSIFFLLRHLCTCEYWQSLPIHLIIHQSSLPALKCLLAALLFQISFLSVPNSPIFIKAPNLWKGKETIKIAPSKNFFEGAVVKNQGQSYTWFGYIGEDRSRYDTKADWCYYTIHSFNTDCVIMIVNSFWKLDVLKWMLVKDNILYLEIFDLPDTSGDRQGSIQ